MAKAQVIITSCSRRGLEVEQIKSFLRGNGLSLTPDTWNVDPDADLILLSTCGFTQAAEEFGFETLRRVQAAKKPGAKVVLGGCIPEIDPARVSAEFGGPTFSPQTYSSLDRIIGARHGFGEYRRPNTFAGNGASPLIADAREAIDLLKTFDGSLSGLQYIAQRLSGGARRRLIRTRYANLSSRDTFYIQIQEGCSMHCTYCAIRTAIGPLRSRPVEAILGELVRGLDQGYRRIQLMGDNAGSFGQDMGTDMGRLLEAILGIEREFVLDLTDIHPVYLPAIFEPVKRLCAQQRVARLYVPIQSANGRILKLMRRDCDMETVRKMLVEIKDLAPPGFRMGTSLIVGFPSETPDELDDTIRFCDEVGFDWVWCHSYSARPETPAAALPGHVSAEEILRRARLVRSRLSRSLVTIAYDTAGSRTCQG